MFPNTTLVYVLVLFGSFVGICVLCGARVLLRQRSVRRFVRSMKQRLRSAEERGGDFPEEKRIAGKTQKKQRITPATDLQKVRSIARAADKALARQLEEEAERLFIQALTIKPDAHDIRAQLAQLYIDTHRESKAVAMYQELLLCRDDVSFFANIGLAYYRQGQYEKAYESYREAYERDSKDANRSVCLARACIASRRFEEAVELLEKTCGVRPRDTELLRLLAECYLQLCNREKAQTVYRRINKLVPYDEEVKEKMLALAEA